MRSLFPRLLALLCIATACTQFPSDNDEIVVQESYIHNYGLEVPKEHWEEAGQSGQVVTSLANGVTRKQTYYFGKLEGETTYTFPYSQNIEKSEYYSQDTLSKEVFYSPSGQPAKEIVYDQPEHIIVREWHKNGQLKSFEKFAGSVLSYGEYYDAEGTRLTGIQEGSGTKTNRDAFGLLQHTDAFKDGQLESRTTFYPNGSPKEITPYKNGIVSGQRKTYFPGGEPKTIETWADGKQQGITAFYVNGLKTQEIPYVNGLKNGVSKTYQDGALVIQEQTWKDDMLHGPTFSYHEGLKATEWYYKGNKVTKGYYDSFVQFTPVDVSNDNTMKRVK
jgi:antitoxin component YwqK of YwqJK toxin-antitoxin module